jgi:hypothetical protein
MLILLPGPAYAVADDATADSVRAYALISELEHVCIQANGDPQYIQAIAEKEGWGPANENSSHVEWKWGGLPQPDKTWVLEIDSMAAIGSDSKPVNVVFFTIENPEDEYLTHCGFQYSGISKPALEALLTSSGYEKFDRGPGPKGPHWEDYFCDNDRLDENFVHHLALKTKDNRGALYWRQQDERHLQDTQSYWRNCPIDILQAVN